MCYQVEYSDIATNPDKLSKMRKERFSSPFSSISQHIVGIRHYLLSEADVLPGDCCGAMAQHFTQPLRSPIPLK